MYISTKMKHLLYPFFLCYRLGSQIKNLLYSYKIISPRKAPISVISIGNITFGGSEKTPLAINLISSLLEQGFKPALVTRGYKGNWERQGGVLSDGKSILGTWRDAGDEPFMVAQNIPRAGIFIGKRRLASCNRAKDMGFQIAVLDDGFQHRRLYRDFDIVLFNPGEKIALREPSSSLRRADVLLIKQASEIESLKKKGKHIPQISLFNYSVIRKGYFRIGDNKSENAIRLKGKKILAFCGIARPERFSALLDKDGIQPIGLLKFPDHHSYPSSSVKKILRKFQELRIEIAITTEKDAVKIASIKEFKNLPFYYLKIDLKVEEEFYQKISARLRDTEKSY